MDDKAVVGSADLAVASVSAFMGLTTLLVQKGIATRDELADMLLTEADRNAEVMDRTWSPSNEAASVILKMLSEDQRDRGSRGE